MQLKTKRKSQQRGLNLSCMQKMGLKKKRAKNNTRVKGKKTEGKGKTRPPRVNPSVSYLR